MALCKKVLQTFPRGKFFSEKLKSLTGESFLRRTIRQKAINIASMSTQNVFELIKRFLMKLGGAFGVKI